MNAPYSEGPMNARICLIGEAPGETEVSTGRPFVGRAGQLLDKLLITAGINRSECRIENVLQQRPPRNDISQHINISKKVPFLTEVAKRDLHELHYRLAECKANVFVPLGNTAMWALTGLKDITKRRGSILASPEDLIMGRKVIPTIHPSSALREFLYQNLIAFDLQRALKEIATPDLNIMNRTLRLEPSYLAVMDYIDLCER